MTDRKKPGVAFWATVALVVLLVYPLSWGPAIYFLVILRTPPRLNRIVVIVYGPLWESMQYCPKWLVDLSNAYLLWWADLGR